MTLLSQESRQNEKSDRDRKIEDYIDVLEEMREAGSLYSQESVLDHDLILKRPVSETLDDICLDAMQRNPNLVVAWILMSSYLYYRCDFSILSDRLFDDMCRLILTNRKSFKHRHLDLLTVDDMRAGTLFDLDENEYPSIVKGAALQLTLDHYGVVAKNTARIIKIKSTGRQYVRDI